MFRIIGEQHCAEPEASGRHGKSAKDWEGGANFLNDFPDKPKGVHWRTYSSAFAGRRSANSAAR
jgi:hypothetical protein